MWFMLNASFPSGSLQFWYVLSKGSLCDHLPIKTLVLKVQASLPGRQYFMCVTTTWWRNGACPIYRERTLGNLCLVSPWQHPMHLSLCWFCFIALYPFIVINLNSEHKQMLRPASHSSGSHVASGPLPGSSARSASCLGVFGEIRQKSLASKCFSLLAGKALAPK